MAAGLAASTVPLSLSAIEQRFKGRGPWKKGLPTLLQTLEALGRAQAVPTGGEVAWRGRCPWAGVAAVPGKAPPRRFLRELATMAHDFHAPEACR